MANFPMSAAHGRHRVVASDEPRHSRIDLSVILVFVWDQPLLQRSSRSASSPGISHAGTIARRSAVERTRSSMGLSSSCSVLRAANSACVSAGRPSRCPST